MVLLTHYFLCLEGSSSIPPLDNFLSFRFYFNIISLDRSSLVIQSKFPPSVNPLLLSLRGPNFFLRNNNYQWHLFICLFLFLVWFPSTVSISLKGLWGWGICLFFINVQCLVNSRCLISITLKRKRKKKKEGRD